MKFGAKTCKLNLKLASAALKVKVDLCVIGNRNLCNGWFSQKSNAEKMKPSNYYASLSKKIYEPKIQIKFKYNFLSIVKSQFYPRKIN
jgi:hypothetical protein